MCVYINSCFFLLNDCFSFLLFWCYLDHAKESSVDSLFSGYIPPICSHFSLMWVCVGDDVMNLCDPSDILLGCWINWSTVISCLKLQNGWDSVCLIPGQQGLSLDPTFTILSWTI